MPRRTKPALTVDQRRRQIIDLIAGHLAAMPGALAVPPESFDPAHGSSPQILPETPQNRLELSAK